MDTFNPKKRKVLSFQEFGKVSDKLENAKHIEKGEHAIVKDAMDGDKKGDKGVATMDESKINEASGISRFIMKYRDEIKTAVKQLEDISKIYNDITPAVFSEIEKKMESTYDKGVGEMIDRWCQFTNKDKDDLVDDIANFALKNQEDFGTEPQFVLEAIEAWSDILSRAKLLKESRNEVESAWITYIRVFGDFEQDLQKLMTEMTKKYDMTPEQLIPIMEKLYKNAKPKDFEESPNKKSASPSIGDLK